MEKWLCESNLKDNQGNSRYLKYVVLGCFKSSGVAPTETKKFLYIITPIH